MQPDERLDAWGMCHELTVHIYRLTASWPPTEVYGLSSQARRAVFAATVNVTADPPTLDIHRRRFRMERALDYLGRLAYALLLAHELGYLSTSDWEGAVRLLRRTENLIQDQLTLIPPAPPRLVR